MMTVNLMKHPFVDLQRSEVKWNKSKPEEGIYDISEMAYVNYSRDQSRPDHWLTWVRYYPEDRKFDEFKYLKSCGYQPVKWEDELYWPENVVPDESGYYVIGDVVLMQRPILAHVKEELEKEALSSKGGKERLAEIEAEIEKEGGSTEGVREYFEGIKDKQRL
jgi:hypothetical protein